MKRFMITIETDMSEDIFVLPPDDTAAIRLFANRNGIEAADAVMLGVLSQIDIYKSLMEKKK